MREEGGGEISLLRLSPFFAFIFPLFPQKRLILRLASASDWSYCVGNLLLTSQKHSESELDGDPSSVWNFCAPFSDVISQGC